MKFGNVFFPILLGGVLGLGLPAAVLSDSNGIDGTLNCGANDKAGHVTGTLTIKDGPPRYEVLAKVEFDSEVVTVGDAAAKAAAVANTLQAHLDGIPGMNEKVAISQAGGVVVVSGRAGSSVGVVDWDGMQDGTKQDLKAQDDRVDGASAVSPRVKGIEFFWNGIPAGARENGAPATTTAGIGTHVATVPVLAGDTLRSLVARVAAEFERQGVRSIVTRNGTGLMVPYEHDLNDPVETACFDAGVDIGWRQF